MHRKPALLATALLALLALPAFITWAAGGTFPPAASPTLAPAVLETPSVTPVVIPSQPPTPSSIFSATLTPPIPNTQLSLSQLPSSSPIPNTQLLVPQLPPSYYILNIRGHHQYFPLGCEAATAKDWANYFGKDFNEFDFQFALPHSDNPDLGFVGDVYSPWGQVPPYAYGVHAGPVADLLNAYGIKARAYKGFTLAQIENKLAQDKPVFAWVIGNVVGGIPYEYTDSIGNKTIVAAYEHVIIITGYSQKTIRYMNNGRFYDTPIGVFLNSFGVLGNMVIVDD